MPPWAAIECARRGESWKVKQGTSYPSSPSVAAAAPPARPVPTTMTLNRRRLWGATSFMSNLCWSHCCSMGPAGTLPSRIPRLPPGLVLRHDRITGVLVVGQHLRLHHDREADV